VSEGVCAGTETFQVPVPEKIGQIFGPTDESGCFFCVVTVASSVTTLSDGTDSDNDVTVACIVSAAADSLPSSANGMA
jgi:hypothetical protein